MATIYRFKYHNKSELQTPQGRAHLLIAQPHGESCSLSDDEFELALQFDGERSPEEVLDAFYKLRAKRVARNEFAAFIDKLHASGLLEIVSVESLAQPARRSSAQNWWQEWRTRTTRRGRSDTADAAATDPSQHAGASTSGSAPDENTNAGAPTSAEEVDDGFPGGSGREPLERGDRILSSGDMTDPDPNVARASRFREPPFLWRMSVTWLLPLGSWILIPLRGRLPLAVFGVIVIGALFGLWFNRIEFLVDFVRLAKPLSIFHIILLSLLSCNFLGQLARAAAARRYVGEVPPFGLILAWNILPRFYCQAPNITGANSAERRKVIAAPLVAAAVLTVVGFFAWLVSKGQSGFLPLLALGVSVVSATMVLVSINPLVRREGYLLLADWLRAPDLRERAFRSLWRWRREPARSDIPPWALRLYALLVLTFLVALAVLTVLIAGGRLENNLGGLGVVVFLVLSLAILWEPLQQLRQAQHLRQQLARWGMPQAGSTQRKLKLKSWQRTALTLAAFAAVGLLPYGYEPGGEFTVMPNRSVDVRALISADVREVLVSEGDYVEEDQLIARLADDEERNHVAVTEAKLQELEAKLQKAVVGATQEEIALARQKARTARTRHQFSDATAKRMEKLYAKQVVSLQDYENAVSEAAVNQQQWYEAQRALEVVLAGTRPEEIDSIRAEIARETAQLEYHRRQLAYAEIRAPVAGRVVSGSLRYARGDFLNRGDRLAKIEDTQIVVAEVRVPQTDIAEVHVGAKVRLKVVNDPHREFQGVVTKVAPEAEPTEYGKIVRVLSEIPNDDALLKSELTGYAKIAGSEMPAALAFTRMIRRFVEIEFWSWLP